MTDADFLFAGAGASGLVTAARLLERFEEAKAALLDPSLADLTNRTYAFWCAGEPPLAEAVSRSWDLVEVVTPRGREVGRLEAHRYHVITGTALREACLARLERTGRAEIVHAAVTEAVEEDGGVTARFRGGARRGHWLFDSRPSASRVSPQDGHVALTQRFLGWDVETGRDAFDDTRVILFDFRTPQQGDQRFVYVLPLSRRKALVEHVSFEQCDHAAALGDYIAKHLGIDHYEVTRRESGDSLMTDAPFPRKLGERTLAIGLSGGLLKPTSGYAFTRIVDDAEHIAASLESHGHPFALPTTKPIFAWLDQVFLKVTERSPERMAEVFAAMFHYNPPDRVFAFLDEHASASEIMKLGANLPVGPFLRVAGPRFLFDLRKQLDDG
jgi:lycopene beta-cyclase